MNRRGLFGAMVGGIAAATGLRSLARMPALRLSGHVAGARVGAWVEPGEAILFKGVSAGKTEAAAQLIDGPLALPGTAPWRTTSAPWQLVTAAPAAHDSAPTPTADPTPSVPDDFPVVWPGHSGTITATASLPPLAQVECLVDLFGRSGESAPAFAAALIGELVLTRMRLADLRSVHAPGVPS